MAAPAPNAPTLAAPAPNAPTLAAPAPNAPALAAPAPNAPTLAAPAPKMRRDHSPRRDHGIRPPYSPAMTSAASERSISLSSWVAMSRSLTLPAASSSPPMITICEALSLSASLNWALSDLP